jgi:hypothetical protein
VRLQRRRNARCLTVRSHPLCASDPDGLRLTACADVDTSTGEVQPHGSLRKVFAVSSLGPCKRLELGTVLRRDGTLCYGGAARSNLSLSSDGLLFLEASVEAAASGRALRDAVHRGQASASGYSSSAGAAAASRAKGAKGRTTGGASSSRGADLGVVARGVRDAIKVEGFVELSQVVLNINETATKAGQDIKVSVGWDIGKGKPYAALKENAWAVRAEPGGKLFFTYHL